MAAADTQNQDPTRYFEELFNSQQINTIGDYFCQVIGNNEPGIEDFFVTPPRHAYYIKRLIKMRRDAEDPSAREQTDEEWLLEKLAAAAANDTIPKKYQPKNPAVSVANWLGGANSITENYALMLCYLFELKPVQKNNTENVAEMPRSSAPLDSADGFLTRVAGINAFNGRDVVHVVHKFCLLNGHSYAEAQHLIENFNKVTVKGLKKKERERSQKVGFTSQMMEHLLGEKGLAIDSETFLEEIITWKPALTKSAKTAQKNYFCYKNKVMLHCIDALQKKETYALLTDAEDKQFRSIENRRSKVFNEHNARPHYHEYLCLLENLGRYPLGEGDLLETRVLEPLVKRYARLELEYKKGMGDLDSPEYQRFKADVLGGEEPDALEFERAKSELLSGIITESAFFGQLVYRKFHEEGTSYGTGYGSIQNNPYLFQFVQRLPLRQKLKDFEKPQNNFHSARHGRDALVLFFFYDYAYRLCQEEKGLNPEHFYFEFQALMEECSLSQPLFRSLYDYTLINCITQLSLPDTPFKQGGPEPYFDVFFDQMNKYAATHPVG